MAHSCVWCLGGGLLLLRAGVTAQEEMTPPAACVVWELRSHRQPVPLTTAN